MALAVGRESLADHTHRFSPKKYTQPQLFACLVYMAMIRADYRGCEAHLKDLPAIREWIGIEKVPDHSTLHRAAQRFFGAGVTEKLLTATVKLMMGRRRIIRRAAADSTGLEAGHRSAYFVRRRARGQKEAKNPLYQTTSYTRFPKLSVLVDCDNHMILSVLVGAGPKPDINDLQGLLSGLPSGVT
ncbi:MAG: hypothetical protein NTW19_20000, partial [Planctomycetota bacterium]|nr:hypothetical protein [Planctomycetota bacterium]